jgi:two-component system response regulator
MILLVEDSPDDEALMVRALSQDCMGPLAITRDGTEALAWLRTALPDLVLLDLNLPGLKGFEVLRQIRASPRTRHLPVVILTSSAHDGDVARSYELGANSFVRKPKDPRSFADTVREIARYWLGLNRGADPDGRS